MILAQQLIDASKDGGTAVVRHRWCSCSPSARCFCMDKVRRRRGPAELGTVPPRAGTDRSRRVRCRSRIRRTHRRPPAEQAERPSSSSGAHRIGGRIWTQQLSDGTPVDRGGARLARSTTVLRAGRGRRVHVQDVGQGRAPARRRRPHASLHGPDPEDQSARRRDVRGAQYKLRSERQATSARRSVAAPRAANGTRTIASTTSRTLGSRTSIGRDLFEMAVRGLFTGDLNDTSLLNLLFLVRGHGSINNLFSIEKGAQENCRRWRRVELAKRMAAALGEAIHVNASARVGHPAQRSRGRCPRRSHRIGAQRGRDHTARADLDIKFDPVLSDDRLTLYRKEVGGPETKTLIVYDEPFWRGDGFSGQTAADSACRKVTLDASPAASTPGVIASFTFGRVADAQNTRSRGAPGEGDEPSLTPLRLGRAHHRSIHRDGVVKSELTRAARWRTFRPGISPLRTASGNRSGPRTGRHDRGRNRTARSTWRSARANELPPRSLDRT